MARDGRGPQVIWEMSDYQSRRHDQYPFGLRLWGECPVLIVPTWTAGLWMQVNRVPILIALVTESVAALYCYLLFKCLFWLPLYAILYTFPMSRAERLFRLLFNSGYIPYG